MTRRAFEKVVDVNFRQVYRYAYHILRDHGWAECCCQEIFMKAWSKRDQVRKSNSMRSWLFAIARTTSIDYLRRQKRVRFVPTEHLDRRDITDPCPATKIDLHDRIGDSLAKLPEETRAAVVLRILEGMSNREVAELLGVSEATTSRRLYEGLAALRDDLGNGF